MHIVKDLEGFVPFWERASLTLGVFDGMHRGPVLPDRSSIRASGELLCPSTL